MHYPIQRSLHTQCHCLTWLLLLVDGCRLLWGTPHSFVGARGSARVWQLRCVRGDGGMQGRGLLTFFVLSCCALTAVSASCGILNAPGLSGPSLAPAGYE